MNYSKTRPAKQLISKRMKSYHRISLPLTFKVYCEDCKKVLFTRKVLDFVDPDTDNEDFLGDDLDFAHLQIFVNQCDCTKEKIKKAEEVLQAFEKLTQNIKKEEIV